MGDSHPWGWYKAFTLYTVYESLFVWSALNLRWKTPRVKRGCYRCVFSWEDTYSSQWCEPPASLSVKGRLVNSEFRPKGASEILKHYSILIVILFPVWECWYRKSIALALHILKLSTWVYIIEFRKASCDLICKPFGNLAKRSTVWVNKLLRAEPGCIGCLSLSVNLRDKRCLSLS